MQLLNKENFDSKIFDQYKHAIVVGKGKTFQPIEKPNEETILIGINDAINHIVNPDMVLTQDIEPWLVINSSVIKNLKYITTSVFPHQHNTWWKDTPKVTYKDVVKIIKDDFKGMYMPYNSGLNSWNDKTFPLLPSNGASGGSALYFIHTNMRNIMSVTTYGLGKGTGHHPIFEDKTSPWKEKYNNKRESTDISSHRFLFEYKGITFRQK
jgi:hypothetical protein